MTYALVWAVDLSPLFIVRGFRNGKQSSIRTKGVLVLSSTQGNSERRARALARTTERELRAPSQRSGRLAQPAHELSSLPTHDKARRRNARIEGR